MLHLIVRAFAVAILFLTTAAAAQAASSGPPATFKLANGLQVVVIEDHRAPVVTHMVWYRCGAADETRGHSGIAHFLEHLMFKGTDRIASGDFSKIVARQGGQDNAFTTHDETVYWQRVARDRLGLVMDLESDRMAHLKLTDKVVLPERDVILEERRMRVDNNPSSLLSEQMSAALYLNHPYGIPVIGWFHEMQKLTRADAEAWYNAHYGPNNAILIVAGDVTVDEVKTLAEKYYGPVAARPVPPRWRPGEPPPIAARRVTLVDARATQSYFSREYLTPSYRTEKGREAYALEVGAEILGGGATSRLYRALVEDRKLAAEASASYSGNDYDYSTFSIDLTPRSGVALAALEAAGDKVIADFLKTGPTAEEMKRAISRLRAAAIYARDSQNTMAQIYGFGLIDGQTIDEIYKWPDVIATVKAEEVAAAMREFLKPERSVTGLLTAKAEGAQ
ncbi:MAG: insulinase family protein [Alphaproteobacteria bacterium]|nr:insulinase family protein [Alphaproteobacteria bacterium]